MDRLPPTIAERLTCSRTVRNHGSYRTILLFNTWDRYQSDVLPRQHFVYCLGHDPDHLWTKSTNFYFHLWLNTVRIYRDRLAVKSELERSISRKSFAPFVLTIDDRAISVQFNFNLRSDPQELVPKLISHYVRLIEVMHPVLMPIIDRYSAHGSRPEIKAEIARRGRISVKPPRVANPELVREYTRSVPPTWRSRILAKWGYRCAQCGVSLRNASHHIDHIVPFSRGGKTIESNLQPLCPACNLAKGNRPGG